MVKHAATTNSASFSLHEFEIIYLSVEQTQLLTSRNITLLSDNVMLHVTSVFTHLINNADILSTTIELKKL